MFEQPPYMAIIWLADRPANVNKIISLILFSFPHMSSIRLLGCCLPVLGRCPSGQMPTMCKSDMCVPNPDGQSYGWSSQVCLAAPNS